MKKYIALFMLFALPLALSAVSPEATTPVTGNEINIKWFLIAVAFLLLIVIFILSNSVLGAIQYNKQKNETDHKSKIVSILILALSAFGTNSLLAAETTAAKASGIMSNIDFTLLFLMAVILAEVVIILYFIKIIRQLTGIDDAIEATKSKESILKKVWEKANEFQPLDQEAKLDTGHNYDGIRELDNITPPWFKLGFLSTIVFAFTYMYIYHVARSAPLSIEEYEISVKEEEERLAEFLKNQKNSVDENSITMMSSADISEGKTIFDKNCKACHGSLGEGGTGPNLTDDFWIHGGKINDVFKTIRYGVPSKGMIAWKEQLSGLQIGQVTSFVKSLKGSNPPNQKPAQGELYSESTATTNTAASTTPGDSTAQAAVVKDSLNTPK